MGRWLSLLLTGLFLLTGCGLSWGKLPFQQEKPRFAVVDWDRLVEQHPKYKEWQRQKEQLETAKCSVTARRKTASSSWRSWDR
mgnify:CR=1 FL=1